MQQTDTPNDASRISAIRGSRDPYVPRSVDWHPALWCIISLIQRNTDGNQVAPFARRSPAHVRAPPSPLHPRRLPGTFGAKHHRPRGATGTANAKVRLCRSRPRACSTARVRPWSALCPRPAPVADPVSVSFYRYQTTNDLLSRIPRAVYCNPSLIYDSITIRRPEHSRQHRWTLHAQTLSEY